MQGVEGNLVLAMSAALYYHDPIRVAEVRLGVRTSVRNPENPLADDFLTRVIRPLLPFLVEAFSNAFWAELPLSSITRLCDLIQRIREYNETRGITDDWYLMNYCPYDGESKTMVVVDRSMLSRAELEHPIFLNPLLAILDATNLYGSYVTDSDEWVPAEDYKKMFGISHYVTDELICVRPTKIVTIGPKSKSCVLEHIRGLHEKYEVISVLETHPTPLESDELIKVISREISAKLGTSRLSQEQP
jgi:hypothetical protein